MSDIKLYPPNASPIEYQTDAYGLDKNGMLSFRTNDKRPMNVRTTLPFLITEPPPE